MPIRTASPVWVHLCSVAALVAGIPGCQRSVVIAQPDADAQAAASLEPASQETTSMNAATTPAPVPPAPGQTVRVGGDLEASVTGQDGDFRAAPCRIDTPLPLGYPAPTPPGAIDLKSYPPARLAEVTGTGDPDRGMNRAFWPLFNHIKRHGIAMTSPVEVNYQTEAGSGEEPARSWSMAFLYRRPDMNRPGVEGPVTVRDVRPVTVVAVGLKGDYSTALVERGMGMIEDWLASNPGWRPSGSWRALYYNGPTFAFWNKWAEVQLPVEPEGTAGPAQGPVTASRTAP
jgi:hypothetical protein